MSFNNHNQFNNQNHHQSQSSSSSPPPPPNRFQPPPPPITQLINVAPNRQDSADLSTENEYTSPTAQGMIHPLRLDNGRYIDAEHFYPPQRNESQTVPISAVDRLLHYTNELMQFTKSMTQLQPAQALGEATPTTISSTAMELQQQSIALKHVPKINWDMVNVTLDLTDPTNPMKWCVAVAKVLAIHGYEEHEYMEQIRGCPMISAAAMTKILDFTSKASLPGQQRQTQSTWQSMQKRLFDDFGPNDPFMSTMVEMANVRATTKLEHIDRLQQLRDEYNGYKRMLNQPDEMEQEKLLDIIIAVYPDNQRKLLMRQWKAVSRTTQVPDKFQYMVDQLPEFNQVGRITATPSPQQTTTMAAATKNDCSKYEELQQQPSTEVAAMQNQYVRQNSGNFRGKRFPDKPSVGGYPNKRRQVQFQQPPRKQQQGNCTNCGSQCSRVGGNFPCRAKNVVCHHCGLVGHFVTVCKKKQRETTAPTQPQRQ